MQVTWHKYKQNTLKKFMRIAPVKYVHCPNLSVHHNVGSICKFPLS